MSDMKPIHVRRASYHSCVVIVRFDAYGDVLIDRILQDQGEAPDAKQFTGRKFRDIPEMRKAVRESMKTKNLHARKTPLSKFGWLTRFFKKEGVCNP